MTTWSGFEIQASARVCCILAVFFSLTCPILSQQNTAIILGTITDPSGAAVMAHITVTDELTGFTRSTVSAADGSFLIPLLPLSAQYKMTAEAPGFKSFTQSGIALQLNQSATDPDTVAWVLAMMLSYGRGIDLAQTAANEPRWIDDADA